MQREWGGGEGDGVEDVPGVTLLRHLEDGPPDGGVRLCGEKYICFCMIFASLPLDIQY